MFGENGEIKKINQLFNWFAGFINSLKYEIQEIKSRNPTEPQKKTRPYFPLKYLLFNRNPDFLA